LIAIRQILCALLYAAPGEFLSIVDFQNTMSGSIMPYITELLKQKQEINAVLVSEANGFFDT